MHGVENICCPALKSPPLGQRVPQLEMRVQQSLSELQEPSQQSVQHFKTHRRKQNLGTQDGPGATQELTICKAK